MEDSKQMRASMIWHNMTMSERVEIMSRVGYQKSQSKYYGACIAEIVKTM